MPLYVFGANDAPREPLLPLEVRVGLTLAATAFAFALVAPRRLAAAANAVVKVAAPLTVLEVIQFKELEGRIPLIHSLIAEAKLQALGVQPKAHEPAFTENIQGLLVRYQISSLTAGILAANGGVGVSPFAPVNQALGVLSPASLANQIAPETRIFLDRLLGNPAARAAYLRELSLQTTLNPVERLVRELLTVPPAPPALVSMPPMWQADP